MQQAQSVALPAHFQALSESAKLYEPGGCYAEFVRNLPKNLPKEHLQSDSVSDISRWESVFSMDMLQCFSVKQEGHWK